VDYGMNVEGWRKPSRRDSKRGGRVRGALLHTFDELLEILV